MRLYTPAELRIFLAGVDAALRGKAEVVLIGGAAVAIEYDIVVGTRDIDTWTRVQNDLMIAVERSRQATGLAVPFAQSGVADGPESFERRLRRALPHLKRLIVRVPEKHDLVLMKVVRGDEHDLQAIEAIHERSPLDLETLLDRYQQEMGAAIIDPRRLKGHVLTMVERLFPDQLDRAERRLRGRPK